MGGPVGLWTHHMILPDSLLPILGAGRFPKPSIAVRPGTEVLPGQAWTIRCWAPYPGMSFVLYRQREFWREEAPRGEPPTAEFHLSKASAADTGRYTCYYHTMAEPFVWSNASDPVELRVTGRGFTMGQGPFPCRGCGPHSSPRAELAQRVGMGQEPFPSAPFLSSFPRLQTHNA